MTFDISSEQRPYLRIFSDPLCHEDISGQIAVREVKLYLHTDYTAFLSQNTRPVHST